MRYHLDVLLAIFFLSLCGLSGCGGGGGGGGSSGGGHTGPTIVYLGSVGFNPAESRDLSDNDMGFAIPETWEFEAVNPSWPANMPIDADQTFTLSQVTISGVVVPCYRVQLSDPDPSLCRYEWWAVGIDGGLYRLTRGAYDHLPGPSDGFENTDGDNPTLLSQPRLILPENLTVSTSWTVGASAGLALNNSSLGHTATRTVEATGITSPNGFPGCTRIRADSSGTVWYEWWMPDRGLVEVGEYDAADDKWVYNIRADFTTSG